MTSLSTLFSPLCLMEPRSRARVVIFFSVSHSIFSVSCHTTCFVTPSPWHTWRDKHTVSRGRAQHLISFFLSPKDDTSCLHRNSKNFMIRILSESTQHTNVLYECQNYLIKYRCHTRRLVSLRRFFFFSGVLTCECCIFLTPSAWYSVLILFYFIYYVFIFFYYFFLSQLLCSL